MLAGLEPPVVAAQGLAGLGEQVRVGERLLHENHTNHFSVIFT
jgi:hypothetical protein